MPYSVAICTFNGEKYLTQQIESILTQSILPKQIVICDDGSTDNTNKIISSFVKSFPSIDWKHIINEKNLGVIKNFELAINSCDEELVFLSDQDDVWLRHKAEKILRVLEQSKYSVVFTDAKIVDENLWDLSCTMFEIVNLIPVEQRLFHKRYWSMWLLFDRFRATGATMAFKKTTVQNFMPFPENTCYYHDGWIATLAACTGELTFINEPLICYRQHDGQQIGVRFSRKGSSNAEVKNWLLFNLQSKWDREKLVLKFFQAQKAIISIERLKFLEKRDQIYSALLMPNSSIIKRFFTILSTNPYKYKLPEFISRRISLANFIRFVFIERSREK